MSLFHKGDKVTVTNPPAHWADTRGKTGVVETTDGPDGLIAVKGIDNRLTEAVRGRRGYTADQIAHSD